MFDNENNQLKNNKSSILNSNSTELAQRTQGTDLAPADLLNNAMSNLTQEQVNSISQKATDEALRLQVKQQEQLLNEESARKETLTHIDTFNNLSKEGRATRHHVKSSMKTGAGTRDIESKSGATCFVASSAFEGQHHPTVQNLRYFRDNTLAKFKLGNSFIAWYYQNGPIMAKKLDEMPFIKPFVRFLLNALVKSLPKPQQKNGNRS